MYQLVVVKSTSETLNCDLIIIMIRGRKDERKWENKKDDVGYEWMMLIMVMMMREREERERC